MNPLSIRDVTFPSCESSSRAAARSRIVRVLCVSTLGGALTLLASGQQSTGLSAGLGASPTPVRAAGPYRSDPVEGGTTKSSTKPDVHGTLSVENFQGTQANLTYTHESADGFRNYLAQFHAPNYVYRDANVGTWQFHDILYGQNYDKWTSGTVDYGIDAVLTSFHSSHGGMNFSTGVYGTSLGSNWASSGWNAYSNKMALGGNANSFGDERLRYMFWDTCFSVKWNDGVNPYKTWGSRAKGIRMIFGYDTVSVDSPNYGKFFWEEWNKGKTLRTAFLDASWRINHGQSPCLVAFGSSVSEAIQHLDTERYMYWSPVGSSAAAWAWYAAVKSSGSGGRGGPEQPIAIPGQIVPRRMLARGNSDAEVLEAARSLGIDLADASLIEDRPFGLRAVHTSDSHLFVEADGDLELQLALGSMPPSAAGAPADDAALIAQAQQMVDRFGLARGCELQVSGVRILGGNETSEGIEPASDRVLERSVLFDQVVGGLPFIDPDSGHLEITFDAATQQVLSIRSSLKPFANVARGVLPQPTRDRETARALALQQASPSPAPGVVQEPQLEIVPQSEQIGYFMQDGQPIAAYRALLRDPRFEETRQLEVIVPLAPGE